MCETVISRTWYQGKMYEHKNKVYKLLPRLFRHCNFLLLAVAHHRSQIISPYRFWTHQQVQIFSMLDICWVSESLSDGEQFTHSNWEPFLEHSDLPLIYGFSLNCLGNVLLVQAKTDECELSIAIFSLGAQHCQRYTDHRRLSTSHAPKTVLLGFESTTFKIFNVYMASKVA